MPGPAIPRDATMDATVPVFSIRSVSLPTPNRGEDLKLRVSAPISGNGLPIILFSHGFGASMDAYGPLTDYWAANGFVVVQPTHLDSRRFGLSEDDPRRAYFWRTRVEDMLSILDNLEAIIGSLPGLSGRADHGLIAAAGHSFGGQTTSMLLGARMLRPDGTSENMADPRIRAGVLLASGGRGGSDLSPLAREITPYLDTDFADMQTPTLVVAGDADHSPLTIRGPDWFTDPYYLSPGAEALLTLFGGEHMLGGISGYYVTETTDEKPERVAVVRAVALAYLRNRLLGERSEWMAWLQTLGDGTHQSAGLQVRADV